MNEDIKNRDTNISFGRIFIRLFMASIILGLASFFTPGFVIDSTWTLFAAAVVITLVDYMIERFSGIQVSPIGRGLVGFIISIAIIYFTKFVVVGYDVTILGAIIGALFIGLFDAILPANVL